MRYEPISFHEPGNLGIFDVMAKALAPSPFMPNFRARWDRCDSAEPAEPANAAKVALAPAPRRGWIERLEHWLWSWRQRDLEAYLAQSADIHDLEARIRNLERERFHPYY